MTPLKPKSAQSGMKSKFIKNRTSAMKEIQSWVRNHDEYSLTPDVTRNSGQLADNVTEERMLKAKLLELSKERYKFLVQNAYEKKMFEDRQQRKAALRHIFSAPTEARSQGHSSRCRTSKSSSSIYCTPYTGKPYPSDLLSHSSRSVDGQLNASVKSSVKFVLDNDPSPNNGNICESRPLTYERSPVSILTNIQSAAPRKIAIPMNDVTINNPNYVKSISLKPLVANGIPQSRLSKTAGNRRISETTLQSQTSNSLFGSESSQLTKSAMELSLLPRSNTIAPSVSSMNTSGTSWLSREKPVSKYGQRIESLTTDPRYAFLEQKLSPMLKSDRVLDVEAIVDRKEALHVRPRRRTSDTKKSKVEVKALEFMKARGLSF